MTEPSRGGEMEAAAFEYHKKEEDLEVESFQGMCVLNEDMHLKKNSE